MGHHSCCNKQKVRRGLWSPEEDEKLINYISTYGHGCWSSVPRLAGLQRCGKSCRLRWINYLRPDLKRGSFSSQEASLIIELHRILGNRWAQIAKHLPGRTDNEVKNFWNSTIKKKLISHGVSDLTTVPEISNSSGSDEGLFSLNTNPNLIISAHQDHAYLPSPTSMLQDNGDLKIDPINYNVNWVCLPPPPPPPLDLSSYDPTWSLNYQSHQNNHQEDYQSLEMYGNEEALHYNEDKFIDAKNMILPYDDDPLVGSMMPNLCEIIDLDECGIPSSSASHEDDPIARFPCFPSGSYPFNSNVMNNQMEYNHAIMSSSLSSPSPLSYGHLVTTTILP